MGVMTLALIALCSIVIIGVLVAVGAVVLLKLGIIVREATKPQIEDYGSYSLSQGREVRPEEETNQRASQ